MVNFDIFQFVSFFNVKALWIW